MPVSRKLEGILPFVGVSFLTDLKSFPDADIYAVLGESVCFGKVKVG